MASTLSTAIEWYDYYLYGLVAGLVFGQVFFPAASPLAGTIEAFGVFGVGFLARPLGAALFGSLGDRLGRKKTLIWSTLCMGIPTIAVAAVPGYTVIGFAGAILLTVLRILQGIGLGGQWAGAVLVSMESGPSTRRGLFASWAQVGSPLGLLLGGLALFITTTASSHAAFMSWAWRLPFLFGGLLIAVTFFIRLRVSESTDFADISATGRTVDNPVARVLRHHWRAVVLAALVRTSEMAPFYIFTTFVVTYGTTVLHLGNQFVLAAVLAASVLSIGSILLFGHLSDHIGRRRMYLLGIAATAVFGGLAYYPMLNTGIPWIFLLAVVLSLIPHDMQYGPQAALIAESFPTNVRYSGAALGSQLASIISGGPAPLIATALIAHFQSGIAVAIYMLVCCLVGAGAAILLHAHADTATAVSGEPPVTPKAISKNRSLPPT